MQAINLAPGVSNRGAEAIRKVLKTIDEVVAEFGPEYIYTPRAGTPWSCMYVHDPEDGTKPTIGCLGGQVLNRLGVSVEVLAKREGVAVTDFTHFNIVSLGDDLQAHERRAALLVLRAAQIAQDAGKSWGFAREEAHASAEMQYGVTLN
jgi:hypothetical protein